MKKKIKVQKLSEKYALDSGKYNITVSVTVPRVGLPDKRMSLNEGSEFVFRNSKPAVVKAIGELIVEASKL